MKILFVDDDVMMLELVCASARARGLALASAASFDEAVEAIAREPFAAAVVDLHLGEASGLEVLSALRERNPDAEAVVVSGDGRPTSVLESYKRNVFAFVPKPTDPDHVIDVLERALERRRTALETAEVNGHVQRAKAEWERTFDAIGDPIAVYDRDGRLVRANRAMLDAQGWTWDSLNGRTCSDSALCGGGAGACAVTIAASRRVDVRAQVALANGRTYEVTTFPAGGPDERTAVVQVAKDVTERLAAAARIEEMRQQLLQAEKLSALGQLVAGVAHELNNPLTSVIGYAQLVQEELSCPDGAEPSADWRRRLASDIGHVVTEAERAARIVRNLLAFARQQSTERRPHDIVAAVESALSLREYNMRQRGIEVRLTADPATPEVVCDTSQIQQVIVNLVLNAERAMRDADAPSLEIAVTYERDAGAVRIDVADTGHGIDPSVLPRIFDPFYTTRPVGEGTGLGLSICYGLVREHGGAIWATSTPGQATRFSILLPAYEPSAFERSVLVAHGDAAMRAHLVALFTGWGHRTSGAGTARDALHVLRTLAPAVALIDRSVLDAEPAAWRDILSSLIGAHLIVASVADAPGDPVAALGADHGATFVNAPYDLRVLRSALQRGTELV